MKNRILLKDVYKTAESLAGSKITVMGWAKTIRDSKAFGFIELNDGSCFKNVQIVFEREKIANTKDYTAWNYFLSGDICLDDL